MKKSITVYFQGTKFPYKLFYTEELDYVMLCMEEEYLFGGHGRTPAKAFDMLLADCQMFLTDYEEGLHSRSDNLKELYDKISSFIEKISKRRKTYSKKYHFAAEVSYFEGEKLLIYETFLK